MTEITGSQPPLTPDVARRDPEVFKTSLLDTLARERPIARAAWERSVDRGYSGIDRVTFDPDSWVSVNTGGDIILGVQPLPQRVRELILYEDATFSRTDEILYRFSHENGHNILNRVLIDDLSAVPEAKPLYNTLVAQRQQTGKGLSGLGSIGFYEQEGANVQGLEDMTELVNMYLWDPAYFARYVRFLQSPSFASLRERYNIGSLDESAGQAVTDIVTKIVLASI